MAPDRGARQLNDDAIPEISSRESEDTLTDLRKASTEEDVEDDEISAVGEAQKFLAHQAEQAQNFTLRGVLVGLAIGVVICFSNTYFGLQTGWVSGMTMPAALIGFAFFKTIAKHIELPFTPVENVLVQTVAGAVGTMPLGCGFVGVMPALNYLLKPEENGPLSLPAGKLILWSLGICFFGVVFAVPLRKEVIIREKLKFPSGTATALVISVLHGDGDDAKIARHECGLEVARRRSADILRSRSRSHDVLRRSSSLSGVLRDGAENFRAVPTMSNGSADYMEERNDSDHKSDWKAKIRLLTMAFGVSAIYTLSSYFIPQLHHVPVFGLPLAKDWLWTLNPSPAYVGQGIIMGPATTLHMLLGAIIGWGILSPLAKNRGWASGPVDDWTSGSKGWIVASHSKRRVEKDELPEMDAPPEHLVANRVVLGLLVLSIAFCVLAIRVVFGPLVPYYAIFLSLVLALLLSIMGVRAQGETDINPVSGISKLTQLVFALVISGSNPNAVTINLLAGAISESGALQAGDMMQDLKTGHLLGASPKAQFYGQVIGSAVGAVVSAGVYKLYTSVYKVPGGMFQVPTGYVWIFTARLVTGKGLPHMAWQWALGAGCFFALTTALRIRGQGKWWQAWIPGGIAVAVGV
ncbi:MAG: hypothetical protein Q9208_002926 [Pyrenodesmia sp. 3 TL-2023]